MIFYIEPHTLCNPLIYMALNEKGQKLWPFPETTFFQCYHAPHSHVISRLSTLINCHCNILTGSVWGKENNQKNSLSLFGFILTARKFKIQLIHQQLETLSSCKQICWLISLTSLAIFSFESSWFFWRILSVNQSVCLPFPKALQIARFSQKN